MKLYLSKQCESLTGSLGKGYGYAVRQHVKGYYGYRNAKGTVPPDGHWRFIVACATLAINRLHVSSIQVHWMELSDALYTARHFVANAHVRANAVDKGKLMYNADDIINLKTTFGL